MILRIVVACLLLPACVLGGGEVQGPPTPVALPSVTEATPAPAAGGTFRVGIGEPTAIIPPLASSADDLAVVDAVFDSLTSWQQDGSVVRSAASGWTASDDLLVWIFTLRDGATFHDGQRVSAADFVAAWELLVREGTYGHLLRDLEGYEVLADGGSRSLSGATAVGERTLQIRLERPRADLPALLGHPALGPVHTALLSADAETYGEQPAGNGPFRLSEPWAHGDFIRTAANGEWRNSERTEGAIDEVLFRIADIDTNFLAFRQGRTDLTAIPPEAIDLALEENPRRGGPYSGPGVIDGLRPSLYVLGMQQIGPLVDAEVRRGFSLAVEPAAIVEVVGTASAEVTETVVPPGVPGGAAPPCVACVVDLASADELLSAAGVTQLPYAFDSGGGHEQIRNVIRGSLAEIDVALVSNGRGLPPVFGDYLERLAAGRGGAFRLSVSAEVPSALEVLYPLLHSSQTPAAGGLNYLGYSSPLVDTLLDQAAATLHEPTRAALLARVQHLAVNVDRVLIPVFAHRWSLVASERVLGLQITPFGGVNLTSISVTP